MKKSIRSLQAGRSMIELIAVMAVMGILLIAALVGFKLLLDYFKQKETIEQVTTIGMRYKASRLNAKTPQQGYVPMNQVFPEGNECENNDTECIVTPEGSTVKLYSMGESKNFVVLVNQLKSTSCEELAMMGGYEFAFTPSEMPSSTNNVLNEISEIIQGDSKKAYTFSNDGIFAAEGKTIALTPEYIKKNPTVLKTFCDPNLPLLGFVYTADEDCDYFYDGECHNCPRVPGQDIVEDSIGECCPKTVLNNKANCGLCNGCGTKKCLEDEQRCVECTINDDCDGNPNGNICDADNHCVECNGENACSDDDECCNAKHECIAIDDTFWTRNANGSCICKDVGLGGECEADCNCAHLGATFKCMNVGGNTVKTCAKDPNGCEKHEDCGGNRVCCKQEDQSYGVCCDEKEFCKDGVCSNCTDDSDCGTGKTCCNGACYSETVTKCGDECCTEGQQCLTDANGNNYCGNDEISCTAQGLEWCEFEGTNGDCCQVGQFCHNPSGCINCSEQPIKTCGDSERQTFNNECYAKKHLNCLDETGIKTVAELIQLAPSVNTPICANGSDETNATCKECESTAECQALESNGNTGRTPLNSDTTTKVDKVLFKDFVCRRGHSGADEKYNGSCGPCIDNTDCKSGVPCLEGKCGCQADTDCEGNIDGTNCIEEDLVCGCQSDADCMTEDHLTTGKTKCNIDDNGVGTCGCDDGLELDQEEGYCVCKVNPKENFWTRYTGNTATDQKYLCCEQGKVATMAGTEPICVPMCEGDEYISVAMMLDYSWSGKNIKVGNTTFDSVRTQLARDFINGLKRINSGIRFGVFREDNNGKTDAQEKHRCEGEKNGIEIQDFSTGRPDLDQDLCAFSNGQGETTFTNAINGIKNEFNGIKKECSDNKENTIVLVLSDGMIPSTTATDTGCKEENMYVYAAGEKSFGLGGIPHEMPFTATPTPDILLNMVADKICVNPSQMPGALQPGYDPQNP